MNQVPFQLSIINAIANKQTESLTCKKLLRTIPDNRDVYDALWDDKPVIVKLFSRQIGARRHLKKEWEGLAALKAKGLSAPAPLFLGKTKDGRSAIVIEKIVDSSPVADIFDKANAVEKVDLLILTCDELARQHRKGVLQKDLHLSNFLIKGEKVFAIDPAQMRFLSTEIGKKRSLSQIALLVVYLAEGDYESVNTVTEQYFKARGWQLEKSDMMFLQEQMARYKRRWVNKGLKKCLRTSTKFVRIKSGNYVAVFCKELCAHHDAVNFVNQIESIANHGHVLKNGNTCYVAATTWNNKKIVIKRYNHKGLIHSLRHTIKRSRARRGWLHANRLDMLAIPAARPLAYVEKYAGPLVHTSYLITEFVDAPKLYSYLRDKTVTKQQNETTVRQINDLLGQMEKHKITHGDLKQSNILVSDNGPVLIDFDALKVHRYTCTYKARHARDLKRLAKHGGINI